MGLTPLSDWIFRALHRLHRPLLCLVLLSTACTIAAAPGDKTNTVKNSSYRPCTAQDLAGMWRMTALRSKTPLDTSKPQFYEHQYFYFLKDGRLRFETTQSEWEQEELNRFQLRPFTYRYVLTQGGNIVIRSQEDASEAEQQFVCIFFTGDVLSDKTPDGVMVRKGTVLLSAFDGKGQYVYGKNLSRL